MSNSLKAYLLLTMTVFFWAGNVIVARLVHADISAIALASGRWWLATLFLLPFAWRYLRQDLKKVLHHWPYITLMSLLGISLFNTLLYESAHTTTSTNIALIQTTMPAMIVLLSAVFYAERTGIIALTGVFVSITGAMLVVSRGELEILLSMDFTRGDLWMLLANLVYAFYSVLLKKRPDIHPMSFLSASFILGSLLLIPFFLIDMRYHPLPVISQPLIYSLLYIAIFPSILSYLFWNRGVTMVGANIAGFFICLIPVFTAIMASIFLQEALHWYHLVGLMLVITGFILFQKPKQTSYH